MKNTLKILSAIVWYIGFIALSLKSYRLFVEAYVLDDDLINLLFFLMMGFLLGLIKTKYIFIKSCKKNLERIEGLENPKIWQFYRVGFFIFLAVVITLGAFLSRWASGDYWLLMSVGLVDMALAFALFFSGFLFFVDRNAHAIY